MDAAIQQVLETLLTREGAIVTGLILMWAFERWQHVKRDKIETDRVERWAKILEGYSQKEKGG